MCPCVGLWFGFVMMLHFENVSLGWSWAVAHFSLFPILYNCFWPFLWISRDLINKTRAASDEEKDAHNQVGVALLYHLANQMNDNCRHYPPTRQFFTSCIEILGQVRICSACITSVCPYVFIWVMFSAIWLDSTRKVKTFQLQMPSI